MAYGVEGRTKDGCRTFWTYVRQSVSNVLCIVSTKLWIFALKCQFHVTTSHYCIWPAYLTWFEYTKENVTRFVPSQNCDIVCGCTVLRTYGNLKPIMGVVTVTPKMESICLDVTNWISRCSATMHQHATNSQQTWRQEFLGCRSSTVEWPSTRASAAGTLLRFF